MPHLNGLRVAANEVFKLWANNYRFASEERLRSHLKKITGYRRIKGDYLKQQAQQFLNSRKSSLIRGSCNGAYEKPTCAKAGEGASGKSSPRPLP